MARVFCSIADFTPGRINGVEFVPAKGGGLISATDVPEQLLEAFVGTKGFAVDKRSLEELSMAPAADDGRQAGLLEAVEAYKAQFARVLEQAEASLRSFEARADAAIRAVEAAGKTAAPVLQPLAPLGLPAVGDRRGQQGQGGKGG